MVRRGLISGLPMAAAFVQHSHGSSAECDPMIRKLRSFVALAGATLFACWNPAVAQTPMPPSCVTVGTSTTCGSSTTNGPASDPFPRTYIIANGGNPGILAFGTTNAGVPFSTVASQSNIVHMGFYLGAEAATGTTAASLVKAWKTAATANGITLRVVMHTNGFAPLTVSNSTWKWYATSLGASNMWAYNSAAGSGTTDLATFNGYTTQGVLMLTPASTQTVPSFTYNGKTGANAGKNVWDNYAQYFTDVYIAGLASSKYGDAAAAANPYLDGFFLDNMTPGDQQVSGNATWNGVGTTPPVAHTSAVIAAIQQGDAKLVAAFQALKSGILLVGNTAYSSTQPAIDSTYLNLWPTILAEEVIGQSYSIETFDNSPPGHFMQRLISAEATYAATGTQVFHMDGTPGGGNGLTGNQSTWGATQWRYVRYGFAAAMQRNYHFAFNCGQQGYSSFGLLDEQVQTVSGSPNWGWLSAGSQRLDPPQSAAWSNGVWRRRFPNGWVLWNPRGNGAQTVTIPSTLCRIKTRGYGDATVNSGACGATTVTLQDADGLFLIGTG